MSNAHCTCPAYPGKYTYRGSQVSMTHTHTHTHTCTPKGKPIHRLNRYQQMCFGPMSKEKTSEIKTQIRFLEIGSMRVMTRRGWWERARWKLGRGGGPDTKE